VTDPAQLQALAEKCRSMASRILDEDWVKRLLLAAETYEAEAARMSEPDPEPAAPTPE